MTKVFFGETYFSHGIMTASEGQAYVDRAKAAGFKTVQKKADGGSVHVYVK